MIVDGARLLTFSHDRWTYRYSNGTWAFDKAAPWPEEPRVMGHWNNGHTCFSRQHRAAWKINAGFPGRHASSLRKDHDVAAFGQAVNPLAKEVAEGTVTRGAVNSNRVGSRQAPAKKWDPQCLFLKRPSLGGEDGLECDGFPSRLMFRQDDTGNARQLLKANDFVSEVAGEGKPARNEVGPQSDHAHSHDRW